MKAKPQIKKPETEKKLPLAKFRSGAIVATVWSNEVEKDGEKFENYTFTIDRSYKDGEEWKHTNSLRKRDMANIAALSNQLLSFFYIDEDDEKEA